MTQAELQMQTKQMTGNGVQGTVQVNAHGIAQNLVYVRETPAADLVTSGLVPADAKINPVHKYFVLCAADGRPLAVLDNRDLAFAAAREHDMLPVSVH
jgi:hypothetical protein